MNKKNLFTKVYKTFSYKILLKLNMMTVDMLHYKIFFLIA